MTALADLKPRVRVAAGRSALLTSAAMPTVQFRGIGAAGKKPAADDDDMRADEEEAAAAKPAEGDDDKGAKKAKKKAKKTARADEDTDDDASNEDDDPDADGDDDDNDEESDRREARGNSPMRAARLRERSRIAAILESPAAAANLDYAVKVALTTDLTRSQAISLLNAAPKPAAGGRLADRMADYGAQRPGPGAAPIPKGQAAIDALWDSRAAANGLIPTRR